MRRQWRAAALFFGLMAVYFGTFTGVPISDDERLLFDAARSFALDGTLALPNTFDLRAYVIPSGLDPVPTLNTEPLQAYLTAPLIQAARAVPGVGVVHAAWLFNAVVTALTGALLYLYGRALGYGERPALIVAAIFGVATIAWPYSQLYFREPLLTLFMVGAAWCAAQWRNAPPAPIWLIGAGIGLVGAALTKDAGIAVLPTLLVIGLPTLPRRVWRSMLPLVGIGLIGGIALIALRADLIAGILARPGLFRRAAEWIPVAVPAYLFSPGFSVWVYSPVLLASLIGAGRLVRWRRWREVSGPLLLLIAFAIGHPALHGEFWYGGLAWGPRFLMPITPFLCLWLLPLLEAHPPAAVAGEGLRRRSEVPFWLLTALSLAVQLIAVWLPPTRYAVFLEEQSRAAGTPIVAWREGVWDVRYHPIPALIGQIGRAPSALAWDVMGTPGIAVLCLATAGIAAYAAIRPRRRYALIAAVSVIGVIGIGLRVYYPDVRYGGDDPALREMLGKVAALPPGQAVILGSPVYRPFMLNYYKGTAPLYTLPVAQGETVDPVNPPYIVSAYNEEQTDPIFQVVLARLALRHPIWWVVWDYTPFTTTRLRVTERYLTRHYYPIDEPFGADTVRLVRYAAISAPPERVPPYPPIGIDADYGAARLIGADVPLDRPYAGGQAVPISLLWRFEGWPPGLDPLDYSVNVSLIGPNGATLAQRAGTPAGTFGRMTAWRPGQYIRDNHALIIPPSAPPGRYEIWVLVFDWRDGRSLPIRNRAAGETHTVIGTLDVK